jgi:hypothetical protein
MLKTGDCPLFFFEARLFARLVCEAEWLVRVFGVLPFRSETQRSHPSHRPHTRFACLYPAKNTPLTPQVRAPSLHSSYTLTTNITGHVYVGQLPTYFVGPCV